MHPEKEAGTCSSVFQKHRAGRSGCFVKPYEAIFLHVPWTSDIRTSQRIYSKPGSWELCASFLMAMAKCLAEMTSGTRDSFQLGISEMSEGKAGGVRQGGRRGEAGLRSTAHGSREHRTQEEARPRVRLQRHTSSDPLPPEDHPLAPHHFLARPSDYEFIRGLVDLLGQNTSYPPFLDTPWQIHPQTVFLRGSQFSQAVETDHQGVLPVGSDVYSCLSETWVLVTNPGWDSSLHLPLVWRDHGTQA